LVDRLRVDLHDSPVTDHDGSWPRVTIVTLSYNQGRFLEGAICSVLLQGYPNLEYIVVDGGSTDGSVEIVRKYAKELAYWSSEPDRGPAAGLNKGFGRATGEILGFLNADDLYLPGSLFKVADLFRIHRSADVIYGDGYMTEATGQRRKQIFSDRWNLRRLAYGTCAVVQPAAFFRRRAFLRTNGISEEYSVTWDTGLWVDLALSGATFHHAKEPLAVFRLHRGSITGSGRLKREFTRDMDVVFRKIMGRRRRARDRALGLFLRFLNAVRHPRRVLGYKLFLRSVRSADSRSPAQHSGSSGPRGGSLCAADGAPLA
jgi:glycosyltransferase involved in cell wall biosynthesis